MKIGGKRTGQLIKQVRGSSRKKARGSKNKKLEVKDGDHVSEGALRRGSTIIR